jgi:HEAT repeat protein
MVRILVVAGVLALVWLVGGKACAAAPPSTEVKPLPEGPTLPREQYRYEGRSFEWWQKETLSELKAQRRIEGIKALGLFGRNGYASEAATTILQVIRNYELPCVENTDNCRIMLVAVDAVTALKEEAIGVLARGLRDKNATVRGFSAELLAGKSCVPASIPVLIEALKDKRVKDALVRRDFLIVLERHAPKRPESIAVAIQALRDEDSKVRTQAAVLVKAAGSSARRAVPALVKTLSDPETEVRQAGLHALQEIGAPAKDVAGALGNRLRAEKDSDLRAALLAYIQKLGPTAKEVVPALVKILDRAPDPEDKVRGATMLSAGPVIVTETTAAKEKLHLDRSQQEALKALTAIGRHGHSAVPDLERLLNAKKYDADSEASIARALKAIR